MLSSSTRLPQFPAGFPTIRAEWQKLENPDLRKALKMKVGVSKVEGVTVTVTVRPPP
jgi:hypothetical protein